MPGCHERAKGVPITIIEGEALWTQPRSSRPASREMIPWWLLSVTRSFIHYAGMLHSPVIPRTKIERPSLLASIRPVYAIVPFSFRKWMPRRATLCDRRNCRFRSLQFVAPSICERSCCSVGMDRDLFLLMASHVSFSRSKTIWSAQRKFERRRIGKEEIRIRINALIFGAFRFSKSNSFSL